MKILLYLVEVDENETVTNAELMRTLHKTEESMTNNLKLIDEATSYMRTTYNAEYVGVAVRFYSDNAYDYMLFYKNH